MLQMTKEYLKNGRNIDDIVEQAKTILRKRQANYERYVRKAPQELKAPLEYYIDNIGTGYFAGKEPKYTIKQEKDKTKKDIIKNLFGKVVGENANAEEMQQIIDFIRDYNDDSNFFYEIVMDYMTTGACCWINYETDTNEIVYSKVSSLQSVAIYDYSTPVQLIGGIRIWQEKDNDGFDCDKVEVITDEDKRYYKNSKKQPKTYKEIPEELEEVKWSLAPFYSVENPDNLALHEPVITLIDAYETVITNNKHLFEYNDNAKLKITGFTPNNELMTEDEDGKMIKNPERIKEDEAILEAPTFYTPDASGDIEWIIKDVNDTASENHKKSLIELILMCSMIPSISEISTTEKTATEIERSFFPLEQVLARADKLFKKELLRMWENIFNRVNIKKKTKFDFREIKIDLQRNLPTDKSAMVDLALKLREVLSDETVLNMLPFDIDIQSELAKKQEENEINMDSFINKQKEEENGLEQSGQGIE